MVKAVILRVTVVLAIICSITIATVLYFNRFYRLDVEAYGRVLLSADHSEAANELLRTIDNVRFVIEEPEGKNEYTLEEAGLVLALDSNELDERIRSKSFMWSIDCTELLSLSVSDEDKVAAMFESLNEAAEPSTDAKWNRGTEWFELTEESYGKKVKVDDLKKKLSDYVEEANESLFGIIDSGVIRFAISWEDYVKPDVLSDDLKELSDAIAAYEGFKITYTNGFSLDNEDLYPYLSIGKNGLSFNEKKFRDKHYDAYQEELNSYNTVGMIRKFASNSGKKRNVFGGTYGDQINYEAEFDFIVKSIKKSKGQMDRKPELMLDLPNKIGKTYVEVDLANQRLWYYVKGKVVMETDVVTGTAATHATPPGLYFVSEKIPGKYLIGDDYKTWVNYWMRITNTGVGLHDAYWRGSFGGTIYRSRGSHGCINLPKDFAVELYRVIEYRTPVVIY